ncbi:MAG: lipopolysaccharide biosynthesis protein [Opitutaceae bacterium]
MKQMLGQKALGGIFWSGLEMFAQRGISFVVQIILARLLLPEQFGLIAMVAVFVAIAIGLADGGFSSAIIQKQNPSPQDLSTVFYFNLGLAVLLICSIYFSSGFIADFYGEPKLIPILRVISLGVLFDALGRIHVALLQKEMRFKQLTTAVLPGNLLGGVAGVYMAYAGFGVWALVALTLITRFSQMLMYWRMSTWRPEMIFSFSSLRSLFPYGSRLAVSSLLDNIFTNIYVLIIGRLFLVADVGLYQKAVGFKNMGQMSFFTAISRVAFPLFSTVQNDALRLQAGFLKAIRLTAFISLPAMAFMGGSSVVLVTFLIGEEWIVAGEYLRLLSIPGSLFCLHYLNVALLKAVGRSDLFLRLEIFKKVMVVAAIFITYRYGIMMLIWGQVVITLISYYMNCFFTNRLIQVSFAAQLKTVLPSLIWGALVFLASASPGFFYDGSRGAQLVLSIVLACLTSVVFLFVFRSYFSSEEKLILATIHKLKKRNES